MKESIIKLIYITFGFIFIIAVLNNESNIGKYVPFGNNTILDTTNGDIYIPTEGINTRYTWKKLFAFKTKEEIQVLDERREANATGNK